MRILFVCHGNICRSVMAQMIFKSTCKGERVYVSSKALSSEEIGHSIYPMAKSTLIKHNILVEPHIATRITKNDYANYDYIYYMDNENKRDLELLFPNDKGNKIRPLLDKEVEDPWYTRDFEKCYEDILIGVKRIIKDIENER